MKDLGIQPHEIWILDLRTERHFFSDNNPIVWKVPNNYLIDANKTLKDIVEEENRIVSGITKTTVVWDREGQLGPIGDTQILTEKDLVEGKGFRYLRLHIVEHSKPSDDLVEELVRFIVNHPHAWIHAHCYVKERSTITLALLDMIHNAKNISFEDILGRQKDVGGSDLNKLPDQKHEHYNSAVQRVHFLKLFHSYCKDVDPLRNPSAKTWKQWLQEQVA